MDGGGFMNPFGGDAMKPPLAGGGEAIMNPLPLVSGGDAMWWYPPLLLPPPPLERGPAEGGTFSGPSPDM